MRTVSAIALSCLLISAAPVFAQDLPDGEGKDVVVKACTSCHDTDNFTSKKNTKDEWKAVVDTMIGYGAEIPDDQVEIITTYLAKNFGKEAAPPVVAQGGLPDGEGKDVVVKACTTCHESDYFTTKKHTKDEWKAVVDTMIGYGAEITDEQAEIIATYLTKNFGKDASTARLHVPARQR
jgi:cytochrome c5